MDKHRRKLKLQDSLLEFTRYFFKELRDEAFYISEHHQTIVDTLKKVERGEITNLLINMPPRYGKAIDNNTPMLTKRGWVPASEVTTNDSLVASDGGWTKVLAVYHQGVIPSNRITFSDGTFIDCCDNHLWQARGRYGNKWHVKRTSDLAIDIHEADGRKKWRIPQVKPLTGGGELPIDPYLFGCWLGDGSSYKAEICGMDEYIIDQFRAVYPVTVRTHQNSGKATEYGIRGGMVTHLKALGVIGNKHIPSIYRNASASDRLALLQGLCDTDGTTGKNNQISFSNTNSQILEGFRFLVVSLGGVYVDYERINSTTINFRLPADAKPFRLKRKAERMSDYSLWLEPRRFISSIVRNAPREMVCFSVDAKDKLFAAGHSLLLTHNTELAVINWMAQSIARNPKAKFIHLSYSAALALDNSSKVREIVKSPAYQSMWPVEIKDDSDSKQTWYTKQGGGLYATMAGGAVTGFGAGVTQNDDEGLFGGAIIIDDPIKPDDANSEVERQKINARLNETIKSRRNSRKTPIIIIMQRLHADDMSGFVLDGGMGEPFHHLNLKALRDDGTALWPMKHTVEELEAMRTHDRMTFATQYQQAPVPDEGAIIKLKWFGRYQHLPQAPTRKRIIHSWDTAFKAKEHNDPSCCLEFHVTDTAWYLADVIHGRWEYPELRRRFFELSQERKPDAILVEDKATGQSLIQEAQSHSSFPVIALKPESDKETRARTAAGSIEAGRIILPEQAHWLSEFESEVMMFPNGKHDDRVDCLSQFINYMRTQGSVDIEYQKMMDRLYK